MKQRYALGLLFAFLGLALALIALAAADAGQWVVALGAAVIDWGGLNVGDPACDLQSAWNVFAGGSRARYRIELQVDDASWLRGRGWALFQAVMALPYYWDTNPGMVRQASHALTQVLADAD